MMAKGGEEGRIGSLGLAHANYSIVCLSIDKQQDPTV